MLREKKWERGKIGEETGQKLHNMKFSYIAHGGCVVHWNVERCHHRQVIARIYIVAVFSHNLDGLGLDLVRGRRKAKHRFRMSKSTLEASLGDARM